MKPYYVEHRDLKWWKLEKPYELWFQTRDGAELIGRFRTKYGVRQAKRRLHRELRGWPTR